MLNRRMIGDVVYTQYEFRMLGASCRDLYTYLVLYSDNDGVCDRVPEIMDLYKISHSDFRSLLESQYILPLLNDDKPNIVVWLPDFLRYNVIKKTDGYAPSKYRTVLRSRYEWAPLLIVRDRNGYIRHDIVNNNDNLTADPRTGLLYTTPESQLKDKKPRNRIGNNTPIGQPVGRPDININKNKINKNNSSVPYIEKPTAQFNTMMETDYGDMEKLEKKIISNQ